MASFTRVQDLPKTNPGPGQRRGETTRVFKMQIHGGRGSWSLLTAATKSLLIVDVVTILSIELPKDKKDNTTVRSQPWISDVHASFLLCSRMTHTCTCTCTERERCPFHSTIVPIVATTKTTTTTTTTTTAGVVVAVRVGDHDVIGESPK